MGVYPGYSRGRVDLDEGHMSYLVRRGTGPWLVLVPGSWCDSGQWAEVVDGLDPDLSLVLAELRGHGGSWPPPTDGSVEQFAQDVLAAADALALDRFFVGGHSIGGMVALEVGRVRPDRVRGVVSVEGWTRHEAQQDAFGGLKDNTLSPEQRERAATSARQVTAGWDDGAREGFRRIWTRWDGYDFLCRTALPVLEIWGDRGLPERPGLEALGVPERENIDVRWIEGASHYLPLERPVEVAAAIGDFIRRTAR